MPRPTGTVLPVRLISCLIFGLFSCFLFDFICWIVFLFGTNSMSERTTSPDMLSLFLVFSFNDIHRLLGVLAMIDDDATDWKVEGQIRKYAYINRCQLIAMKIC